MPDEIEKLDETLKVVRPRGGGMAMSQIAGKWRQCG